MLHRSINESQNGIDRCFWSVDGRRLLDIHYLGCEWTSVGKILSGFANPSRSTRLNEVEGLSSLKTEGLHM
jgi:hypothetical protein